MLYEPTASETQGQGVNVGDIVWDSNRHTLTIGSTTVLLTATEYRLLYPLRHGVPVTYANLARVAYNYAIDEKVRTMMDKHIDRIRGKLRGTGIYVYCVLSYGYLLLPELITGDDLPGIDSRESAS
jgi:DNA-binding response OmpR family regulator